VVKNANFLNCGGEAKYWRLWTALIALAVALEYVILIFRAAGVAVAAYAEILFLDFVGPVDDILNQDEKYLLQLRG
jgi:hypothetical protein